ncbi:MAG: hypothetical protein ACPG4T_11915 [Nannocystaceae bacterium]
MPTYWLCPMADISVPDPGPRHYLSESLYGLVGGGYDETFDAYPPVFSQIQRIAGVDINSLLPLYICDRYTENEEMPSKIERVSKPLDLVRERFHGLRDALLRRPGWELELTLPTRGHHPDLEYFQHFSAPPPLTEEQAQQLEWGLVEPEELENDDPSFREDMGEVLRFLDHAKQHGGTRFWFLGR